MRPAQWAYQLGLREWNQLHKLLRKQAGSYSERLRRDKKKLKRQLHVEINNVYTVTEKNNTSPCPSSHSLVSLVQINGASLDHFIYLFLKLSVLWLASHLGKLHFGDISPPENCKESCPSKRQL